MTFSGGRGFWRGRGGWNLAGQGLEQTSLRKRKLDDHLPEMFERKANIQHVTNAEAGHCSQRHWQGSSRGNSFRGSLFGHGFRQSQSNPTGGRWKNSETYGRRFQGNESYTRTWKNDKGNESEQTVSGDQRGEDRQKKGQETRTGYRRNDLFHLSKTMSRLLRHEALKAGLRMEAGGYVFVSDLLRCKALQGHFTEDDVRRVTEDNDKQRFQLKVDPVSQKLMVRANQGHTIQIPDLELESITDACAAPVLIHGTFLDIWPTIKQQGLSRMSRNHIHFSVGKPGEKGVISGMRRNCQVLIYINIKRALEDGIQFFRSANNVILSPGDDKGFISSKYFDHVEYRLTGKTESKNELDSTRKANSQEDQTEEAGPSENKKQRREERKAIAVESRTKALL